MFEYCCGRSILSRPVSLSSSYLTVSDGHQLDEGGDHLRGLGADGHPVPGVGLDQHPQRARGLAWPPLQAGHFSSRLTPSQRAQTSRSRPSSMSFRRCFSTSLRQTASIPAVKTLAVLVPPS